MRYSIVTFATASCLLLGGLVSTSSSGERAGRVPVSQAEETPTAGLVPVPDVIGQDIVHGHAMYYPGTIVPREEYVIQNPSWRWPNPGGSNPSPGTPVTITYSVAGMNDLGLSCSQVRSAIREALALWASYAPLNFVEVADSGECPSRNDPGYPRGATPDLRFGSHSFDGGFGVLAHAYYPSSASSGLPGDVHYDCAEVWATAPGGGSIIDILEVTVHEVGHALGLAHEESVNAIMNPFYGGRYSGLGTAFLLPDDIAGIRAIYGSGTGSVTPLSGAACGNCAVACDACLLEELLAAGLRLPGTAVLQDLVPLSVSDNVIADDVSGSNAAPVDDPEDVEPTPAEEPAAEEPTEEPGRKIQPLQNRGGRRLGVLDATREFRDTVLASTAEGRELTRLYYEFSPELSGVLARRGDLAAETTTVALQAIRMMDSDALASGQFELQRDLHDRGVGLIRKLSREGSVEMQTALEKLINFIESRSTSSEDGKTVILQLTDR